MKTFHVSITHRNGNVYAWSGKARNKQGAAALAVTSFGPYIRFDDIETVKVYRRKNQKPDAPWVAKVIDFQGKRPHTKERAA